MHNVCNVVISPTWYKNYTCVPSTAVAHTCTCMVPCLTLLNDSNSHLLLHPAFMDKVSLEHFWVRYPLTGVHISHCQSLGCRRGHICVCVWGGGGSVQEHMHKVCHPLHCVPRTCTNVYMNTLYMYILCRMFTVNTHNHYTTSLYAFRICFSSTRTVNGNIHVCIAYTCTCNSCIHMYTHSTDVQYMYMYMVHVHFTKVYIHVHVQVFPGKRQVYMYNVHVHVKNVTSMVCTLHTCTCTCLLLPTNKHISSNVHYNAINTVRPVWGFAVVFLRGHTVCD